jgi:ornithine cyclodeaminase/alanine dehydrogenase-like protein (mu-crystallin family)
VATLILTQPQIRALLPMSVCMNLVSEALTTLARGGAHNPLRWAIKHTDGKSLLGMMPGSMSSPHALGLKVVTVFPGNHGTENDSHQGVVLLFDTESGVPRAILDASEITAIRTAAASGVATRVLSREDAGDLAILGSGVQARVHLEAMIAARTIRRVRVYSPSRANREAFAERESMRHGIYIEPAESAAAAVEGADLVCTTTSSRAPVLEGRWLLPGAHVNAVGACLKSARELDTEAVQRSRFFVDRRESALNESGDSLIAKSEGAIGDDHILGELGDVLIEKCAGRRSSEDITLFESLGIAVEDLAAAHYLDRRAREKGVGTLVELGGKRHDPA